MAYLYKLTISNNQGRVIKQLPEEIKFPFLPDHLNKKHSRHYFLFIDAIRIKTTTDFSNTHRKISDPTNSYLIPSPMVAPGFYQLIGQNIKIHSLKTNF